MGCKSGCLMLITALVQLLSCSNWKMGNLSCTLETSELVKKCRTIQNSVDLPSTHSISILPIVIRNIGIPTYAYWHPYSAFCYNISDWRLHILLSKLIFYSWIGFRFPLQNAVIEFVVQVAQAALKKNKKTLIVVGAYSIGKERVYLGIAEALNVTTTQIFALT